MKAQTAPRPSLDIESLNETIVNIDLDDLEVEALDERIELTLAVLFGDEGVGESTCGEFSCSGYWH